MKKPYTDVLIIGSVAMNYSAWDVTARASDLDLIVGTVGGRDHLIVALKKQHGKPDVEEILGKDFHESYHLAWNKTNNNGDEYTFHVEIKTAGIDFPANPLRKFFVDAIGKAEDNDTITQCFSVGLKEDSVTVDVLDFDDDFPIRFFYCPPNELLTLKMAHRYMKDSKHHWKTRRHIMKLRESVGEWQKPEYFEELEAAHYAHYKHPSLKQSKKGFFSGDGVKYVYDHDSIHEAVALGDAPAYTLYQSDAAEVMCDKSKWDALPHEVKLVGVLEEVYVLALERSQIPHGSRVHPRKSFEIALAKVTSSITSGWFREFAWEHADEVRELYDPLYVGKFLQAVGEGRVKKHGEI